jgi:hypothetical protein
VASAAGVRDEVILGLRRHGFGSRISRRDLRESALVVVETTWFWTFDKSFDHGNSAKVQGGEAVGIDCRRNSAP